MIELSLLEVVLLLANGVFLYLYFKANDEIRTHRMAVASILYGIHSGKLKITDQGDAFKVEPT
jgi:hypothetical protein